MTRGGPALLGLVLVAAARNAGAVCTAAEVIAGCGGSCTFDTTTGTISRTVAVAPTTPGGVCTFDFGTREITLAGSFIGGSNAFELRAAKLTILSTGRLSASGGSALPGGMITLTLGAGGLTVTVAPAARSNPVDVSGAGGGILIVQSDGDVTINRLVLASARNDTTAAGKILITAGRQLNGAVVASGSITVNGKSGEGLIAETPTLSSMAGGTITLRAIGGSIDLEDTVSVSGGTVGAGTIDVTADQNVVLGVPPSGPVLLADGFGDAGSGGTIDVCAGGDVSGVTGVSGAISAAGHSATLAGDPGGFGGTISLEAKTGSLAVGAGAGGKVAADGGSGGCAGALTFMTDAAPGPITVDVPVTATGTGGGGGGGTVCVDGQGDATFSQGIDVSGGGGGGGSLDLSAIGTFTTAGAVRADGTGDGGCIGFCAGAVTFGGPVTAIGLTASAGGGVMVSADRNVSVSAAGVVDVSSTDGNSGGCVDLEAGGNLTLSTGSIVDANAGAATAGSAGGLVCLVAGTPDLPGDLTVGGNVHANGSSPGVAAVRASLEGCTIHFLSTAILDTSGDTQARNGLTARRALIVDPGAQIKTTGVAPTSRNNVALPIGAALPTTGFTPSLVPSDVTQLPLCTTAVQSNCLIPCPTCGNRNVEFPETCDTGGAPNACCDATCRVPFCDDFDACTVDACSVPVGCTHTRIPGCTTTTTTTPPRTTTTTTHTTTTTTTTTTTIRCGGGLLGDCNVDGRFDLFDILTEIDIVLARTTPTPAQQCLCDDTCDGRIDIFDILREIDGFLGRIPTPFTCPAAAGSISAQTVADGSAAMAAAAAGVKRRGNAIVLENREAVHGLELTLSPARGPVEILRVQPTRRTRGFTTVFHQTLPTAPATLLVLSPGSASIQPGHGPVAVVRTRHGAATDDGESRKRG